MPWSDVPGDDLPAIKHLGGLLANGNASYSIPPLFCRSLVRYLPYHITGGSDLSRVLSMCSGSRLDKLVPPSYPTFTLEKQDADLPRGLFHGLGFQASEAFENFGPPGISSALCKA